MAPKKLRRWFQGVVGKKQQTPETEPNVETGDVENGEKPPPTETTKLLQSSFHKENNTPSIPTTFDSENEEETSTLRTLSEKLTHSVRSLSRRISSVVAEHTGSIGYLGSVSIAANSLTGPAMLELPAAYAESGFIPTTCVLFFVCFLSAFCSLHMSNAISKVSSTNSRQSNEGESSNEEAPPEIEQYNHDFRREVEFSTLFSYYWGRRPWFYITQILFWGCITCLNISSIVDTAQVVDTILGHTTGSVALKVGGGSEWVLWNANQCSFDDLKEGYCLPFANSFKEDSVSVLFTSGTLITTLCFLPLALMDMKENAAWQISGFLVLLVASLQFIIQFSITITEKAEQEAGFRSRWYSNEYLWGHDYGDLFGVVLFNYALVIAVPAWLYERDPHVDVPIVIFLSSFLSTFLYITIGYLGRLAMPHVASNMLASLMSGVYGVFMQIGASIFAFFIIGLGIPLFSVLTRLNLVGSSGGDQPMCTQPWGNLLAVYVPFGFSWFLYDEKAITNLLSWGGTVLTSVVAFILPLSLALFTVKRSTAPGAINVYGPWLRSEKAQTFSLQILLVLALVSIAIAFAGKLF